MRWEELKEGIFGAAKACGVGKLWLLQAIGGCMRGAGGPRSRWEWGATVKAEPWGRKERTDGREALEGEQAEPRDSQAVVGVKVRQGRRLTSGSPTWGWGHGGATSEIRTQEERQVCREDAEAKLASEEGGTGGHPGRSPGWQLVLQGGGWTRV